MQEEIEEEEIFRLAKPVLKNAPKVLGKIDLSSINQATHPTKKTKEEKRKEREAREPRLIFEPSASEELSARRFRPAAMLVMAQMPRKTARNANANASNNTRWT